MHWEFNLLWFIIGLVCFAAGLAIVRFYRQIADNMASGVASYDRIKLFGIIITIVGMILAFNIHTLILHFIFHFIMPDVFPL